MAKKKRTPKAKKSPEDSFAPIAKELAVAYGRVNSAPARRLKWLLNFSGLDLDSLSEGRLADLRWELVVFGLNRKPEEMRSEFGIFFDLRSLVIPGSVDLQRLDSIKTKDETKQFQDYLKAEMKKGASLDLVREFQATMRGAFDALFTPAWWEVTRPTAVERIALNIRLYEQTPPAFTGHDILLMQAIDLIKAEKERLKICQNPKCQKRFVAAKKDRAFFHSRKCSAYVRVNKKRGKL
jgi:hypothetical protein